MKALYNTDYEIVGIDGENHATGLYAVPVSYKIPYASSPDYIGRLMELMKKEGCSMMFPGLDAELPKLAAHREQFQKEGLTLVVSSPEVVEISDNKLLTSRFLEEAGLPAPQTCDYSNILDGSASMSFPFILKPKKGGTRSKNVFLVKKQEDLDTLQHLSPEEFIAQEYIEGDEYTCGSVSFDGECFGVIIMRRILRDGDTYKCYVEFNPVIEEAIHRVIRHLKPFGPLNIQLRMKNGQPYIFELNARCSGTTAARAISGFNEPAFIADYLTTGKKPEFEIKKTTIFRYWKEFVADDAMLENIDKHQYGTNPNFNRL